MSNNVIRGSWGDRKANSGHTGGQPPGGDDLEKRVQELEKAIPEIRERLARVETKLDGIGGVMATKSDIADLKVDVYKAVNEQTWKFIAVAGVLAGIAFTAARFIPGG
ncbi:hypothetical protein [Halopseudomonas pertucinogena]|uniref:DUF3618 domain-containing protein n=1 Tax=Halopseudomonas pertucinogena TaxID=86175 RepID=A0ABQ2CRM6_9GAMM|nr:hypothetical protein [Halopseudomonas pertucinogena]GGJ06312.1 hypothetical protein GCM10009083_24110 [Halopseudomonas pertucinogena]